MECVMVEKVLVFALLGCCIYLVIAYILSRRQDDRDRLENYFQSRGCQILSMHMVPIAVQWGMDRHTRIYKVTYRNQGGSEYTGRFRTSSLHGVEPLD